jgi:allophanate hydrolase subunit 2
VRYVKPHGALYNTIAHITRQAQDVITAELPSEGAVAGAIQIPPNGLPVVFLTDHPVIGGYPVIAAVVSGQLALAGQLPPGNLVRFRPIRTEPDRN